MAFFVLGINWIVKVSDISKIYPTEKRVLGVF